MDRINKIASRLVLSYLIGKVDKEQYGFFNGRKFPILFVGKISDNKYHVYKFLTFPKFIEKVCELHDLQLINFYEQLNRSFALGAYWKDSNEFISMAKHMPSSFKKRLENLRNYIANRVFGWFKQNGHFPNNGYESLLCDWEKDLTLPGLAKVMVKELNASIPEIESMFSPIEFEGNGNKGDLLQFKHNKWNVVFESGLKDKEDIIKLLNAVESKCGRFKSLLCYGLVEVKRKMNATVLADYNIANDSMRIKGKRPDGDFVKSFLHELGHRLWYVHLSPQERSLVKNKYSYLLLDIKYMDLKVGDIVKLKDGFKIKIDKVGYNGYSGVVLEKPPKKKSFKEGDRVSLRALKETSVEALNDKKYTPDESSFPTTYSQSSPEEFFAECFAFYLLGTLGKPLASWMKELIG